MKDKNYLILEFVLSARTTKELKIAKIVVPTNVVLDKKSYLMANVNNVKIMQNSIKTKRNVSTKYVHPSKG